ncbi:MAG: DNA alkylation repair protein [Nanoarchaeota archaeon]|nr:DNA alkylation repair protein [Nanoarchaeota archaeon]
MLKSIRKSLRAVVIPGKKDILQGFFKTGEGEYGAGDVFLGVMVPDVRRIAQQFRDVPLSVIKELLYSRIHEERVLALMIINLQFSRASPLVRKQLFSFYCKHRGQVNNWDLVDGSAPSIVGAYLLDKDRSLLYRLVKSKSLWDRRIAMVATLTFIRIGQFDDTLKLSELLLDDKHDLLHKASGWMLREVGKKDVVVLKGFLNKHAVHMPRTMLRYAIERLSEKERLLYLKK